MWALLQIHAKSCQKDNCPVPRCQDLRAHNRQREARRIATWRDWARGLPADMLVKVTGKVVAAETRGPGSTLMAITCKGWKNTLAERSSARRLRVGRGKGV